MSSERVSSLLSLFSSREKQRDGYLSPSSSSLSARETPLRLNAAKVKRIIIAADAIVSKWDPNASAGITSLWYQSRQEAGEYLRCIANLQRAMQFIAAREPCSPDLVQAHRLMETAMNRLQMEFFQILSANRDCLDPESVSGRSSTSTMDFDDENHSDNEIREAGKTIGNVERVSSLAMADLRSITECMIDSGYGKECVKIYKIVRKSIVEEGLYRLGVEPLRSSKMKKMDWCLLEEKVKTWTHAVKIAVRTLFPGERILCDHIFQASQSVGESCFADITSDGARLLFSFPKAVAKTMKSPEKMFKMLEMYDAIAELWPEIESVFSYESLSSTRAEAVSSLIKLGETVRTMLVDFESAIQKDWTKTSVHGGGLHPLTLHVMNLVTLLAESRHILADITVGFPIKGTLPDDIARSLDDNPISVRFAWFILLLLCKIEGKADLYQDVQLSYLFLTNNLQYILGKVQNSDLRFVLGDSWIRMHVEKLLQYATSFEQMAWSKVTTSLTEFPTNGDNDESVKKAFQRFNSSFEEAYQMQTAAIVTDTRLRDQLKVSIIQSIVPLYRSNYNRFMVLVANSGDDGVMRYSPDDLENYISDIFHENGSGSNESTISSVHSQASCISR